MKVNVEKILKAMEVTQARYDRSWPREGQWGWRKVKCVSEVLGSEIDRT